MIIILIIILILMLIIILIIMIIKAIIIIIICLSNDYGRTLCTHHIRQSRFKRNTFNCLNETVIGHRDGNLITPPPPPPSTPTPPPQPPPTPLPLSTPTHDDPPRTAAVAESCCCTRNSLCGMGRSDTDLACSGLCCCNLPPSQQSPRTNLPQL